MLAALVVFGRRAERAAYAQVEGQPGAAAAALGVLRRGWKVQQAVAVTKNQDLVHRVVGRPGVILVGEGNPARVRHLLGVEKKKHARVVGEVPIFDVLVAEDEPDGIPIKKLSKHIMKLPQATSRPPRSPTCSSGSRRSTRCARRSRCRRARCRPA